MSWYNKITSSVEGDMNSLVDAVAYYERELFNAQTDLQLDGERIEVVKKKLPSWMAYRFNQLQELEAILRFLEIRYNKTKGIAYKKYLENYNKTLTSRDAEKYAECDDDVLMAALLVNQISLLRNKYLGITKGLEALNYQITSIAKLRIAGIEDATL